MPDEAERLNMEGIEAVREKFLEDRKPSHQRFLDMIEAGNGWWTRIDHQGTVSVYAVKSNSDPMKLYYVIKESYLGYDICSCDAWRFRGKCSHIDETP